MRRKLIIILSIALIFTSCGSKTIKEVPDDQRALYESVNEEVNARAEKLAREELGLSEGELMMGLCHGIWYHKKRILKEEYGIDWHSPAELHPEIIFD